MVSNGERRYFTVDEANAQIPVLERTLARLLQVNAQLKVVYRELDGDGFAPASEDFVIDPPGASPPVVQRLASLRTLLDAAHACIDDVADSGAVVKAIDQGLIDWYALREGEEVFLCWRLGEKSIQYWHELDAGYAGRRPIHEF